VVTHGGGDGSGGVLVAPAERQVDAARVACQHGQLVVVVVV
jgi:hypothetical protein